MQLIVAYLLHKNDYLWCTLFKERYFITKCQPAWSLSLISVVLALHIAHTIPVHTGLLTTAFSLARTYTHRHTSCWHVVSKKGWSMGGSTSTVKSSSSTICRQTPIWNSTYEAGEWAWLSVKDFWWIMAWKNLRYATWAHSMVSNESTNEPIRYNCYVITTYHQAYASLLISWPLASWTFLSIV